MHQPQRKFTNILCVLAPLRETLILKLTRKMKIDLREIILHHLQPLL